MVYPKKKKMLAYTTTPKICEDCGADISHRGPNSYRCTQCQHIAKKQGEHERYLVHRDNILKKIKERYPQTRLKSAVYQKEYRKKHDEERKAYDKAYYTKNREKILARKSRGWRENPELSQKISKERYQKNQEEQIRDAREYRKINKDAVLVREREVYYPRKVAKENTRRKALDLPPVGKSYKYEAEFKKHLDALLPPSYHADNRFWKLSGTKITNVGQKYGGLQLDRYYPYLCVMKGGREYGGLAFEHDGLQHREYNPHFHKSYEEFLLRQENDRQTDRMCEDADILLVRFPYRRYMRREHVAEALNGIRNLKWPNTQIKGGQG